LIVTTCIRNELKPIQAEATGNSAVDSPFRFADRNMVRIGATFVLAILLAACGDQCDVSEDGPAVQRVRAMSTDALAELYTQGVELASRTQRSTRIAGDAQMPSGFAALDPMYVIVGRDGVWAKTSGCIDAAVSVSVRAVQGVELSWGEQCAQCRELIWSPVADAQ
jgi:hypothetical protein